MWGGSIDQKGMGWGRQINIQTTVGSDKFLVQKILVFIDEKKLVTSTSKSRNTSRGKNKITTRISPRIILLRESQS